MTSRLLLLSWLLPLLLIFACQDSAPTNEPEPNWTIDYEAALTLAKQDGKTVLLDFTGSDWCPPCKQLDARVFRSPRFRDWSEKQVVLVKVDFPRSHSLPDGQREKNDTLASQFRVSSYPTVVVVDEQGRELVRWVGYRGQSPDDWIQRFEDETGRRG